MRTLSKSKFNVGDNVFRSGDSRPWHVYEIRVEQDDAYQKYYVYRIHTRATHLNPWLEYGTEYAEARGSQLRKAK